ncbi:hypothetical protein F1880_009255 [Penicillium rolfsii]|nr:hypothetical protein F1880_009255 [Penicillium rolfsii]
MGARCAPREVSDLRASNLVSEPRVSRVAAARVFESSALENLEFIPKRKGLPRGNGWQNWWSIGRAAQGRGMGEEVGDDESEGARTGMG